MKWKKEREIENGFSENYFWDVFNMYKMIYLIDTNL